MSEKNKVELWMRDVAEQLFRTAPGQLPSEIAQMIADASPRFVLATLPEAHVAAAVRCPLCSAELELTVPAQPIPLNSSKVSILAVVHVPTTCGCGRRYVPFLTGGNLQCALAEIEPASPIVLPFPHRA